jgi:glycerol-3-phosphate dehydrogenase
MTRSTMLDRIRAGDRWDLVVIGGGATGLGTAVDASARGFRTLLLDGFDFAKGTSSRSTKLVHGGLRYLAQGRIGLVHEALHERGVLRRNAPHLVRVLPFLIPAYARGALIYYGVGLKIYDLLAGRLGLGSSHAVSRAEALKHAPTLEPEFLRGGLLYFDGQFDDSRLAIALLRTLVDLGGTALNYAPVTGLLKTADQIAGVKARDTETGEEFAVSARAVVNATGVYADALRHLDDPRSPNMITPSQGAHLVLDRSFLPGDCAVMIPRTDDGRVLFAIPWHNRVIIGTTDTPVSQLPIEPRPLPEEVSFLLSHAARYLSKDPSEGDVRSVYAGLRPLVASSAARSTASLSRSHKLLVSPTGLVTITGGKWTTYRRMGAEAVTRALEVAGLPRRACPTEGLQLHGWQPEADGDDEPVSQYGSDAQALEDLIGKRTEWAALLHPLLPYRAGEVVWAARFEFARTVEDVLSRRTRALLLDVEAATQVAPRVAALVAEELGFGTSWQRDQVQQFQELAAGYRLR